jgi:hypothetical protein
MRAHIVFKKFQFETAVVNQNRIFNGREYRKEAIPIVRSSKDEFAQKV